TRLCSLCCLPPTSTLFPYTTLFRSRGGVRSRASQPARRDRSYRGARTSRRRRLLAAAARQRRNAAGQPPAADGAEAQARHRVKRSEEHTSELQSRENLVCRLLLEKK